MNAAMDRAVEECHRLNTAALTSAVREVWDSGQRNAEEFVARVAKLLLDKDFDLNPEIIAARLERVIFDASAKTLADALRVLPVEDPRWLSLGDAARRGGLKGQEGRRALINGYNRGVIARRIEPGQTWRYSLADVVRFVASNPVPDTEPGEDKMLLKNNFGGRSIDWWNEQDDGKERASDVAQRFGVTKEVIYRERRRRGFIGKPGRKPRQVTTQEAPQEALPRAAKVCRPRRRPIDKIIDAVGQLVDAGVMSAGDGLAMLRKRK